MTGTTKLPCPVTIRNCVPSFCPFEPEISSASFGAGTCQKAAQGLLLLLIEAADGGGGYALGVGVGAGQLTRTGLGEVQQGDPAIGGMRHLATKPRPSRPSIMSVMVRGDT